MRTLTSKKEEVARGNYHQDLRMDFYNQFIMFKRFSTLQNYQDFGSSRKSIFVKTWQSRL